MANIVRRDPAVRDMLTVRDVMDRMFDDFFTRQFVSPESSFLNMDMYQNDEAVVVKATIPGAKPEDINISVTGGVLSIRGEVKHAEETKNVTYHLREQSIGSFARSVTLPSPVMVDKAKAEFENGILTLTLPKAEEIRPKQIAIKTK